MIENIVSGIIGGLIVLIVERIIDHQKERKANRKSQFVALPKLKIANTDFLNTFEPGTITIQKVHQILGNCDLQKSTDLNGDIFILKTFHFQNAKAIFSYFEKDQTIASVTILSFNDPVNPVNCRFSLGDDDVELGKAIVTEELLENNPNFENGITPVGGFCVLSTRFGQRPIKYLTFSYQISGNIDTLTQAKGKIIEQVCISSVNHLRPMFPYEEVMLK